MINSIEANPVEVEVNSGWEDTVIVIAGLPDSAVKESRNRVMTEHRAKKREDRQGGGVWFCFPVGTSAASRKT
jgi:hypothetical protein